MRASLGLRIYFRPIGEGDIEVIELGDREDQNTTLRRLKEKWTAKITAAIRTGFAGLGKGWYNTILLLAVTKLATFTGTETRKVFAAAPKCGKMWLWHNQMWI